MRKKFLKYLFLSILISSLLTSGAVALYSGLVINNLITTHENTNSIDGMKFTESYATDAKSYTSFYRNYFLTALFIILLCFPPVITVSLIFSRYVINRHLINRVMEINEGINRITKDDFHSKIEVSGDDELSQLAYRINVMSARLYDRESDFGHLKEYLYNIINSMPSLIFTISPENRLEQKNSSANDFFKFDKLESNSIEEILPIYPLIKEKIIHARSTNEHNNFKIEFALNNETYFFMVDIFAITTPFGIHVVIRMDNITELEKRDRQLFQAQKMEVIGILAGGFAHNLNNVLSGIIGSVSLLKYKLDKTSFPDKDFFNDTVKIITTSAERAVDMAKQLLTLSRKKQTTLSTFSLADSIDRTIKLCQNTFDKIIQFSKSINAQESFIMGDPSQVEHMLLNLCVNAYHSMTLMRPNDQVKGGTINISLENYKADEHFIKKHHLLSNDLLLIKISDTGVGIPKELITKIFEPFFTTKEAGKGTGLGLSMVYNIIQENKGYIEVDSQPGIGSTFMIYFPKSNTSGTPIVKKEKSDTLKMGSGNILIIDDEDLIRQTASSILKNCGYTTSTVESGKKALELLKNNQNFNLIILDMIMPEMNGKETFIKIKELLPAMKVLLSSGHIPNDNISDLMRLGFSGFLKKPYNSSEISNFVYNIIAKNDIKPVE